MFRLKYSISRVGWAGFTSVLTEKKCFSDFLPCKKEPLLLLIHVSIHFAIVSFFERDPVVFFLKFTIRLANSLRCLWSVE